MHHQFHGYFGLIGIQNAKKQVLPNPLVVSALKNVANNEQAVQKFYDRFISDMIAEEIEGSSKKTSIKKLRLHRVEYEWANTGAIMSNDGPTMIYLIFKGINSSTRIGVLNLKYEIEKATLSNFGNNLKDLLDDMYSYYSIIMYK